MIQLIKRASLLSVIALLVTSCGSQNLISGDGKVVSCSEIKTKEVTIAGTSLECLDQNSKIKLESITGPTLINVWGSWCPPCRQELPLFKEAFRAGKVKIIGIDIDEPNVSVGQKFAIKAGITWPNLIDPHGATKSAFGLGVPVTWFINGDGVVTYKHIGAFTSAAQLETEIRKYLG